jgi:membrane-associated phospholipid phosphatase
MKRLKYATYLLLFFSVCGFSAHAQNFDTDLLRRINHQDAPFLRGASKVVSYSQSGVSIAVPVVMGAAGLIKHDDNLLKDGIYVFTASMVSLALTQTLKRTINRPRPFTAYSDITDYDGFVGGTHSFPSGHSSAAFCTATALTLKYPKWYVAAPSYLWACSVGYSRMNLGVHYPSDVAAGAVLGAGSAYLTYVLNEWFWQKRQNRKILTMQNFEF